jgi:hypothetical protein
MLPRCFTTGVLAMQATVSFVFSGVPSFFRAGCAEARRQLGGLDYSSPGYHLMLHVRDQQPYDANSDEWEAEIERLCALLEAEKIEQVVEWFVDHFPRCMALVPKRRRLKFTEGVMASFLVNETGETNSDAWIRAREIIGGLA